MILHWKSCSAPWRRRLQRGATGVTPRFLFTAPRYRKGLLARISAPLLVTLARDDEVVSSEYIKRKLAEVPRYEIREYPVSHFEMYHGATQRLVATAHLDFLRRNLLSDNTDVG